MNEQIVNPFDVKGANIDGNLQSIDYNKLIDRFGTKRIDDILLERIRKLTGKEPHIFLKRGLFFSHRDLNELLDRYEMKKPFYLYTGRGPSSDNMHIGHMIPFIFCKYLQETFNVLLVIQLTDDEKFIFNEKLTIEDVTQYSYKNIKDIISFGFKPEKTFIFSNLEHMNSSFYKNVVKISSCISVNSSKSTFGFSETDSIGKLHFVSIQAAPSFSNTFPELFNGMIDIACLIPCAIDQDPYFRLTRDVAHKLKYLKPSLIHSKFLPALQGLNIKMSASKPNSAIFLNDTNAQIKNKINKYAFSGGGDNLENHRKNGGNVDIDVSFQYLKFFLEDDDELNQIRINYSSGKMLTGELKNKCITILQKKIIDMQNIRNNITDQMIEQFTDLNYRREF